MKAVSICVEYDDLLALTLPTWLRHFKDIWIVTTPEDEATRAVARAHRARVLMTDVFYRDGREFNKGAAMELGFDAMGRDGWLCVLDADIVLPSELPLPELDRQCLYGAHRRELVTPADYRGGEDWSRLPAVPDTEMAGYFHLFHAGADVLKNRPWYPTNYRSAATCDSVFQWKFGERQHWLPFEVLHLGPTGDNWCGRTTRRLDGTLSPAAVARARARDRLVHERLSGNAAYERMEPRP